MEDICVCCGEYIPEGRMVCYSCEKLSSYKNLNITPRRELVRNKLYSLILILIGVVSILIDQDATFFIFALVLGLHLFFAKENWIT
jgi:hypothetical protein